VLNLEHQAGLLVFIKIHPHIEGLRTYLYKSIIWGVELWIGKNCSEDMLLGKEILLESI
jgi:hypothetical protein